MIRRVLLASALAASACSQEPDHGDNDAAMPGLIDGAASGGDAATSGDAGLPCDAGPPADAGPAPDAAVPADAGLIDAGPFDAGPFDAGPFDAGPFDAGHPCPDLAEAAPDAAVIVDASA